MIKEKNPKIRSRGFPGSLKEAGQIGTSNGKRVKAVI
jgi:hypothetical protein